MHNSKKAFSLIEMSVVIVILAVLTVVVLGGRFLIDNYTLSRARQQTNTAPVNGIEDVQFWLETADERSFDVNQPQDESLLTNWKDINLQEERTFQFSDTTNPPTYIRKGINNIPSLDFTGSDGLASNQNLDLSSTEEFTVYIVAKPNSEDTDNENTNPQILLALNDTNVTPVWVPEVPEILAQPAIEARPARPAGPHLPTSVDEPTYLGADPNDPSYRIVYRQFYHAESFRYYVRNRNQNYWSERSAVNLTHVEANGGINYNPLAGNDYNYIGVSESYAEALAATPPTPATEATEGQPAIEYQAPVPGYWDYDNTDVTNEYTSILGINNNGLEYTDLSNNDNIIGESSTDTAIYKLHYNDSRIVIEKNNNVISTSETSLDPSSSGLVVGRNFSGLIGEVIFFDRRVTTTEDNSISDYLSKKWGTYE